MDNLILKPEILTHPNIPKPLHGLNPRTLLGKEWWDLTRYEAQKRTGFRCIACGVKKINAKKFQWLEGHEYWNINYSTGVCEVVSIEPLCHYCHSFIHSGRLRMIMEKEKSRNEVIDILNHGFSILSKNELSCFPPTFYFATEIGANTFNVLPYEEPINIVSWNEWCLLLEGKKYYSKFRNIEEWEKYYENNS